MIARWTRDRSSPALTLLGAGVTIYGFAAIYVNARREYRDAQSRISKLTELERLEDAQRTQMEAEYQAGLPEDLQARIAYNATHAERQAARAAQWEARYAEYELTRVTYGNIAYIAAFESRRLLGLVLQLTGRDVLVAAVGLLISTGASAWSLFVT